MRQDTRGALSETHGKTLHTNTVLLQQTYRNIHPLSLTPNSLHSTTGDNSTVSQLCTIATFAISEPLENTIP